MANTTDVMAKSVHGTNPQNMVEYIIRQKIYDSMYWKQDCFGLTAELLVDKGVDLRYVGGMYGDPQKPSEFLCLILKMLQIQPDKDIIVEFIKGDEFKYLRLLGAFYMRLVGRSVDIYQYLEPLYNDFRKVRVRDPQGSFQLSHIDQLIDDMLRKDYCFDIALPRLPARKVLEETGQLEPRISILQDEFDAQALQEEKEDAARGTSGSAAPVPHEEEGSRPVPSTQGLMEVHSDSRERRLAPARNRGSEGTLSRRSRSRSPWRMSKEERHADRDRRRGGDERRGRERHRDRSNSRERRRHRSRSDSSRRRRRRRRSGEREGSRSRRKRRTSRSPSHSPAAQRGKERSAKEDDELEIIEANKLRASLGLRPLRT